MKVSIPKQEIDKIVEKYNCSEAEAIKAYLDAEENAKLSFENTLRKELSKNKGEEPILKDIKLFTPKEIKEHLDKYIIGQEEYKERICIAAAYHFSLVKYCRQYPDNTKIKRFRKKNTFISGPSGSGKTYTVEILGDFIQIPTLIVDATDYTEVGYVGKSSDDMVRELIDLAPGNSRKEQAAFIADNGGIIFIDEMDKKAKEASMIGADISREGFQRSVLKLIERKYVHIDNPYSPASQINELMERQHAKSKTPNRDKMISTENILFILGGSFERGVENLENIVKKRIEHKGHLKEDGSIIVRGFGSDENGSKENLKSYYKEATAEDYIRFGLLPELVGRVPIRTFVNLLSKNDLIRIMTETEDSILTQYKLEFSLFNIDLEFTPEAIEYVAEISANKKTGARALVSVWEGILTDFQFELPSSDISRLIVDRMLCYKPKDSLLKMLNKTPFEDFIDRFEKEYGIKLIIEDDIKKKIELIAIESGMQLSETINMLLSKASCLAFMDMHGPFKITMDMITNASHFDKLYSQWHQNFKMP